MGRIIIIILLVFLISGCAYRGTIVNTEDGMTAESNRPMELSKTIDKDGNITIAYSSKKAKGWLENILTIIGLRAIKE